MSLRTRLSLVTVVVAALALAGANLLVYELVSRYMDDRFDERIDGLALPTARFLVEANLRGAPPPNSTGPTFERRGTGEHGDLAGAYGEVRSANGEVLAKGFVLTPIDHRKPPHITRDDLRLRAGAAKYFDTTAAGPSGTLTYRVRVGSLPDSLISVTALPSAELTDTKHQIVLIQLFGSLGVVALGLVITWLLVGLGLRPLRRIEATAGRIADGDLSQRVEPDGKRTEIGRLGTSLNAMLGEIESAFGAKEASERTLRRFVADASHELRTPLTSIRGYAELLRRGADADPEERLAAARRIEQESTRMGVLVDNLLLLARLDEGLPFEHRPVDLTRIARDLVQDARVVDPGRAITVDSPATVTVAGDGDRLTQVVANLLVNARTYTPANTPIELRVGRENGKAQLDVIDHGPGVDAEVGQRVFDRFWRADDSRSRASGGTGLGLAIVAAIVTAHHGTYSVEPTHGGGSTFRVTLPIDAPAVNAVEGEPEPESSAATPDVASPR
jgi:two-component system OmpR family sensor kinase